MNMITAPFSDKVFKSLLAGLLACQPSILLAQSRMAPAAPSGSAAGGAIETSVEEKKTADSEDPEAKKKNPEEEEAAAKEKAEEEEAKKKEAEEEKRKKERLDKIKKATFNRTVGAMLNAWSGFEEEKKEEQQKAGPPGAPAPGGEEREKEPDPLDAEIVRWQKDVTEGDWESVKKFLGGLSEEEAKEGYAQMLKSLQATTPAVIPDLDSALMQQVSRLQMERNQPEKNVFQFEDVLGLVACAPHDLDEETIAALGTILRASLESGNAIERFLPMLEQETGKPETRAILSRREAAKLLKAANRSERMGLFLPQLEKAVAGGDHEALNLLSAYYQALYARELEPELLEKAWNVTLAVAGGEEVEQEDREEALKQAVSLAPRVRENLGEKWLEESFTNRPERGMEVIRVIGSAPPKNLQIRPTDSSFRLRALELQSTAAEALVKVAPERAGEWRSQLNLLAGNWLREAEFSYRYDESSSANSGMQRDRYGNWFYADDPNQIQNAYVPNRVRAISTEDILKIKPGETWIGLVDESLKPQVAQIYAQLFLKASDDEEAFPYIEQLATTHPERAGDLVDEFLRVWTRNHDPNADRNRTNYYMYMYGYERKAESIPLTRSKQERNLAELAELVKRLRALPLEDLDEKLLARAFTTCHSSAEVYRLEAIEKVFGSMSKLGPETLAELTQQMRANLAGVWRSPAVQKDKKTMRKQKDIQAEVLRGYGVCNAVIDAGLAEHPGAWQLVLAKAAIGHDENNYQQELAPSPEFSGKRQASFDGFARAAELYAAAAGDIPEDEETTSAFELWFYASLGACDLPFVDDKKVSDLLQPERIREAMQKLPGESAERHMASFANALFTRMSAVKPAVKFRYLKSGFAIAGDHEDAVEARKVFDYYKDLVTEIKLETVVDGSDVVGHEKPFGLFVNIVHTREIERESGGFGRYLQNQNSGQYYYYNYGRPLENYREKFEEIVNDALGEHFEVRSVTFQSEEVNSRAVEPYGWRVTPYAYVLLRARGPEVDQVPALRLDLDFLDTSGYAVLPVESPIIPVDAAPEDGEARPVRKLEITQTLDERQAGEGKLVLEITATGRGLVPELEEILELAPGEFDVIETADQGLAVSRFDEECDENAIISERSWMVTLQAAAGLAERPRSFRFGGAVDPDAEMTYQRYVDADLATAGQTISLEEEYGEPGRQWVWIVLAALAAFIALAIVIRLVKRIPKPAKTFRFEMPAQVTPFTVIGLLKQIQHKNGFDEKGRGDLATSIESIERFYFDNAPREDEPPDLASIAKEWVRRAR